MTSPKRVLSIAGSDSGGGAGIQADIKTISALGCFATTAITALTAQNTQGVQGIHAPPPEFLAQQLKSVFEDIGVDAVKIGMLHSPEIVDVVAAALKRYQPAYVVLDPVMVATSGDALITPLTQQAIVTQLFNLATVITPNLDELSLLVGRSITLPSQFQEAAQDLFKLGAHAVLVKGGHLTGPQLIDSLFESGVADPPLRGAESALEHSQGLQRTDIVSDRINTPNLHGTGCTLSSAIACYLAQGYPLRLAVKGAQDYVHHAIDAARDMKLGHGHGPVNHFFSPNPMALN